MNNDKKARIYYISQYDNCVHNINDVEHILIENNEVYQAAVGKDCGIDGFRINEEVTLWTIEDIINFYK